MDKKIPITTLFLDIGGVLLSNGWGHESRKSAADFFKYIYVENWKQFKFGIKFCR